MTQFIKTLLRRRIILGWSCLLPLISALLGCFLFPAGGHAQSTFLPQGSRFNHFLDRMEILQQTNGDLNIASSKLITRKLAVRIAKDADSLDKFYPYDDLYHLSPVDRANLSSLLMNNLEWVGPRKDSFLSKRPWFNTFYNYKANFYEVEDKDFFLVGDPVIQGTESVETGNSSRVFLNEKGLTLRGIIAGKLGFSSFLTDNQERGPSWFQQRVAQFDAVPGAGYWQSFKKTGFDYYDNRASIYFNTWKYFDWQFGYDKNFIGNGYRSLFLSDYSAPYTFLKFNLHIWRLNYQTIYMELISQHTVGGPNYLYPKKYGVTHYLNFNATHWLTLGLFENVAYSRANHFDFSYLNPVIFLVSAQQQNGSPDKTNVGLDWKLNIGHATQFYGQLLIDEFILHQILHYSDGYWANKQGLQLGFKYINAFNVKNLDLQFEANAVRPYTYQHDDTVDNYSNYNQPLAHPLGANFYEFIVIARYQPKYRWNFEGKMIYYKQGLDSAGVNFGSNVLENYVTRPRDYGFQIGSGVPAYCINVSGLVSWQCKENLFFDLSAQYRNYLVHDPSHTYHTSNSTLVTAGVRINMFRREYDY
jgi:hypothetical protein